MKPLAPPSLLDSWEGGVTCYEDRDAMMVRGSGQLHSRAKIQQDNALRGKEMACELVPLKKKSGQDRGSELGIRHMDAS